MDPYRLMILTRHFNGPIIESLNRLTQQDQSLSHPAATFRQSIVPKKPSEKPAPGMHRTRMGAFGCQCTEVSYAGEMCR